MRPFVLLLAGLLVSPMALAQYRCVENGKTIFSDRPCAAEAVPTVPTGNHPKVVGDAGNAAYSTPNGDWRGQVQFQVPQMSQPVAEAHAVIQAVLAIDPQGKVTGSSPENGCKFVGIAGPGMAPTILNIDVTLSRCRYPGFNRRLHGSLSLYPAQKYAQLWIYAHPVELLRPGRSFEIKGTLRR